MGETLPFIPKTDLTPEQREYWEERLEIAERQVEYCKRMLGKLSIEAGVTE